ncbi:MAG TPA: hypothetical protein VKA46_33710 [Gemmataceae bacterium]|nr:hypothetical protein [Gemmataceae bacterium]
MTLNRFGKLVLASVAALSLGLVAPAAYAGDGSITQQQTCGKNTPCYGKQPQQQNGKGKNNTPNNGKHKGINVVPVNGTSGNNNTSGNH